MYKGRTVPGISKSVGPVRSAVSTASDNDELLEKLKRKREFSSESGCSTSAGNPKQAKQELRNVHDVCNFFH
jgi:hypothetical protein